MTIRPELIDELLQECSDPREILSSNGLIKPLTKAISERCVETEREVHLGYPKDGHRPETGAGKSRNGASRKKLKSEHGEREIAIPRDREASCEPQLIEKQHIRLTGFEDKILALSARGMTTRDIQAQVQELYGVEISPTLVPHVTEAVMDEVRQWQNRPLDAVYPILYVDGLARESARESARHH